MARYLLILALVAACLVAGTAADDREELRRRGRGSIREHDPDVVKKECDKRGSRQPDLQLYSTTLVAVAGGEPGGAPGAPTLFQVDAQCGEAGRDFGKIIGWCAETGITLTLPYESSTLNITRQYQSTQGQCVFTSRCGRWQPGALTYASYGPAGAWESGDAVEYKIIGGTGGFSRVIGGSYIITTYTPGMLFFRMA